MSECHISGVIDTEKCKTHSKQYEGKCADNNVAVSKIQICDISVLFGKWNFHANSIQR